MIFLLNAERRAFATAALRERFAETNRVELWYARLIVEEAFGWKSGEADGMMVSRLLRSMGWRKADPGATGRDIAYARLAA